MAKKIFAGIVLLAVFFLIGRAQKSPSSDPVFGLLPKSEKVPEKKKFSKTEQAAPTTGSTTSTVVPSASALPPSESARLLREGSGGELFSYLFDGGFQQAGQFNAENVRAVQQRFAKAYPRQNLGHVSLEDREAAHRMGILKAMGLSARQLHDPQLRRQVISFYERILATPHEQVMVKRQAFRSLMQTQPEISEAEQSRRIAKMDKRVLSLSAMSDRELIEAALEK